MEAGECSGTPLDRSRLIAPASSENLSTEQVEQYISYRINGRHFQRVRVEIRGTEWLEYQLEGRC
jgi:hypothetical protein